MANESIFTPDEQAQRMDAALRCTYEVESIARHLNGNLPNESEYLFLRYMVLRILDLNGVAMSALGDDRDRTTAEMLGAIGGGFHGA